MKVKWDRFLVEVKIIDSWDTLWGYVYHLYKDRHGNYYATENDNGDVIKLNRVGDDTEAKRCFVEYMENMEFEYEAVLPF